MKSASGQWAEAAFFIRAVQACRATAASSPVLWLPIILAAALAHVTEWEIPTEPAIKAEAVFVPGVATRENTSRAMAHRDAKGGRAGVHFAEAFLSFDRVMRVIVTR